ncbi:MAG: efflux RND transporter periplasmic adaptor subunit [Halioglobus sp.]
MNRLGLVIASLLGAGVVLLLQQLIPVNEGGSGVSDESQPLYWVAPMDPDYRRDVPGKSPMGMDLVPVYADQGQISEAGTVHISPAVVSNLGVRTERAAMAQWSESIRTVGYVTYDEDRLVHIHPRVSGWIERLHVNTQGDPVALGQPLYELYSPELVNAQEEFLLARKRNNRELMEAASSRLLSLHMSQAFIDSLQKEGVVKQTVTFRAAQSGVVDALGIREGFYVEPGTTLMSIGSLEEVWVEAEVFERQSALVRAGMTVTMTLDYMPGREWRGKVDYVYPTLDPVLRTARLRLRFANADRSLKPNMFAQVQILSDAAESVLTVPREAVIRTGKQDRVVLALGEGRFKSVAIIPGRIGSNRVEVLEGLSTGDTVVSSAQFLLDSESSRESDFKRMEERSSIDHESMDHGPMDHESMNHNSVDSDADKSVSGQHDHD